MENKTKKIIKLSAWLTAAAILLFIIIYALLVTLPYTGNKSVSAAYAESFDTASFNGTEESGENRVTLLDDGFTALAYRIALIESAQATLEFSSFSVEDGEAASVFAGALLRAADRGVKIRLILDGKFGGFKGGRVAAADLYSHPNITLYRYNAFNFFRPRLINAAMHDKYLIADGKNMILGGRNVGDRYYFEQTYGSGFTHDREVYVAGDPVIGEVLAYFNAVAGDKLTKRHYEKTNAKKMERIKKRQNGLKEEAAAFVELNSLTPLTLKAEYPVKKISFVANPVAAGKKEPILGYTLARLAASSAEIFIQSPYCVLSQKHFERLKELCEQREVTILTNSLASTPNLPAFSSYTHNRKKYAGLNASLYEYQSQTASIHAKTFIFDNRLTAIGSFNLDERSLHLSTESMLIIDSESFAAATQTAIDRYLDQSLQVEKDGKGYEPGSVNAVRPGFFKKFGYNIVGFFLEPFKFML